MSAVRRNQAQAGGLEQQQLPAETCRARVRVRRLGCGKGWLVALSLLSDLTLAETSRCQIHAFSYRNPLNRRGSCFLLHGQPHNRQENAPLFRSACRVGAEDAEGNGEGLRYCL